jgi:tRNA pseudouridine55 synthase
MRADRGPHGWLVIDKPPGLTSNRVVQLVRRNAGTKTGHAGTLDPLATGVLPIAIGEATKTAGYAVNGRKWYRFRIRWGVARTTDDREGEVIGEAALRPCREAIEAVFPRFTGVIRQAPPAFSAIKVGGRRAYMLARSGEPPVLPTRLADVSVLRLAGIPDPDHADCEALVGKGTYIRALARDLGVALGTFAHIAELRRLSVGPFTEKHAVPLDFIMKEGHISRDSGFLLPIETALDDIPALAVTEAEAARLRSGQKIMPGRSGERADLDRYDEGAVLGAWHNQVLVALIKAETHGLRPVRVINL